MSPQMFVFIGVQDSGHSVLLMVRNDSFRCHRGFVRAFWGQKRVFQQKLALDTSGGESEGVSQPYSRAQPDGEKKNRIGPRMYQNNPDVSEMDS